MSFDVSIYYSRIKTGYKTTVAGGTARGVGVSTTDGATSSGGGTTSGVVRTTGDQRAYGIKYWDASANFTYDISIGGNVIERGSTLVRDASLGDSLTYDEFGFLQAAEDPSILDYLTINNEFISDGTAVFNGLNTYNANELHYGTNTFYTTVYGAITAQFSIQRLSVQSEAIFSTDILAYDGIVVYKDASIYQNLNVTQDIYTRGSKVIREASLGDTLYWEAGLLEASTGTSINTLGDIGDVTLTSVTTDQIIKWNGSAWVNADNIGDVTQAYVDASLGARDVSIAYLNTTVINIDSSVQYLYDNPVDGSLAYEDLTNVTVTDVSDNDAVMYDYSSSKWENVRTEDISDNYYTKTEVDNLIQYAIGGTY